MNQFPQMAFFQTLVLLWIGVCLGCQNASLSGQQERPPRPVSVITLTQTDPGQALRLTGSVGSWKHENVGFEVAGRIRCVVEPGTDVQGRGFDENDEQISEGDVLGELDDRKYRLGVKVAQAQLQAARDQVEATRAVLEKVMPQQLAEAEAALDLATKQFHRLDALVKDESAPVVKRDEAEMTFKAAQAKVQQVRAGMVAKQAELAAHQSQVQQAEEALEKATMDLDDCQLIAPFRGEVAAVHGIRGGMVAAGTPVVTLVMMDPLKVEIAVSAEKDRQLNFNDIVTLHVPGFDEPLDGYVYMKNTAADPLTRTFITTILVRNRRTQVHVPDDPEADKLPRTENLWRLMLEEEGKPGPYFVEVGSLYQDDEGYFVWKAEELTFRQLRADFDPVIRIRKVRVRPGLRRVPLLNVYTFRELVDAGDLNPATDLLASKLPNGLKDGDTVFFSRERWVLRPGDLVEVSIDDDNTHSGFYVPMKSILQEVDKHFVFVVGPNSKGVTPAEKVEVKVFQAVGEFRRIASVEPDQLTEGSQVVLEGAHYLVPGEPVNVYEIREVAP